MLIWPIELSGWGAKIAGSNKKRIWFLRFYYVFLFWLMVPNFIFYLDALFGFCIAEIMFICDLGMVLLLWLWGCDFCYSLMVFDEMPHWSVTVLYSWALDFRNLNPLCRAFVFGLIIFFSCSCLVIDFILNYFTTYVNEFFFLTKTYVYELKASFSASLCW